MDFSIGKRIKSYIVFTSIPYRVAVWVVIPVGLTVLGVWGGSRFGDIGLLFALILLEGAEVLSDSWLFGGIQAKDSEKIDYLKSSGRGMAVIGNALVIDLARKLFTALGVAVLTYCLIGQVKAGLTGIPESVADFVSMGNVFQEIGALAYLVLLSYSVSVLGTFLSRYGSTVYGNMLIGYGAMMLTGLACVYGQVLSGYSSKLIFLLDLLAAAAAVGASILAVRAAMKKVKGGYYDE